MARDPNKKSAIEREIERWDRTVAAVLAASRRDADLTQSELADKLGWSRSLIANIEKGRRTVLWSEVQVIARVLGVDAEVMFRRLNRW